MSTLSKFVPDPTTSRTIENIETSLRQSLKRKYGIDDEEVINSILSVHGLSRGRFDFVGNLNKVLCNKINDVSIDDNANKFDKTIEGLIQEVVSPIKKSVGFDFLYQTMRQVYGKKEAKRLSGELYDLSLSLHDSTKILMPYCYAFNASNIVLNGRAFGQLHSVPPSRIESYTACLNETIHQMSNHVAGAVAVSTIFIDFCHILLVKEGLRPWQIKDSDKKLRKRIENCFQSFVHSVNHLSRSAVESPFSNISIFDRPKLRTLVSEMDWYFPGFDLDSIVECIIDIQDIFLDFFDKGDPTKGGLPYRFPIVTINISKKKNCDGWLIEDEKFLESVANREVYRYNIFSSEGTKIASCCRLVSDSEMLEFGSTVNSFGGAAVSMGSHRVVTININRIALEAESVEDYYRILNNRVEDTAKILKAHKELIKMTTEEGIQMFITLGWIAMNRLFSTFGIIGEVEANETLKTRFGDDTDHIKGTLELINKRVKELSEEYGIFGNIEQVPGESMAVRLANVDRLMFGDGAVRDTMYSNQFVPLWEDSTIWERMEADGKYNELITGGGIVHIQIGEKTTPQQSKKIIEYAIKVGNEHFALNSVYTQFRDDTFMVGRYKKSPQTGSEAKEYYTRVVGFFTPVGSWNKTRRRWEFPRRKFNGVE